MAEQPSVSQPPKQNDSDFLKDWSKSELYTFYTTLKTFGSHDTKMLNKNISTKTPEQIQQALAYYKKEAMKEINRSTVEKNKRAAQDSNVPLAAWAKHLTDSKSYEELLTEIPKALRMIAELEDIPAADYTDNIDFRKMYRMLADAMEGKKLPKNKKIAAVLNACITEAALRSKRFPKNLPEIDLSKTEKKEVTKVVKPTTDFELGAISFLSSQQNYNPLNVSEEQLKYPDV